MTADTSSISVVPAVLLEETRSVDDEGDKNNIVSCLSVCVYAFISSSKGMFRNNSQILLNVLIIFGFQERLFMGTHVYAAVQHFLF